MSKKIFSFIGLPASGKGTQVDLFAKKHRLEFIGIGDLVRKKIEENRDSDPFFQEIRKRYENGVPQSDEVVFDLVGNELLKLDNGVVFDNFPFTLPQADFLERFARENSWDQPIIIYLRVEPETVVQRITQRKICSKCGSIYISGKIDTCEKCGGTLIFRTDDNVEVVKKRINHYLPNINEIVNLYRGQNRIIEINGEPSIEEVEAAIETKVDEFIKLHKQA